MSRALAAAAALLAASIARAQPTVALRLAYAPALGSAAREVPMSEVTRAQVPIQVDALWRFGAASAGVYGSWGPGQVPSSQCRDGASCSASALSLGLQAQYALRAFGPGIVPWSGLGVGWERARHRDERLGSEAVFTWSGFEVLLQAGAELPLGHGFSVGPFAQLAIGRYGDVALDTHEASVSAAIDERAFHAFLHLGVRGKLDL